jgi:EipB-like
MRSFHAQRAYPSGLAVRAGLTVLATLSLALSAAAQSSGAAGERVFLAAHRAVYEISLDGKRPAKGVDGARGRLAFDFTGDACDGYAMSFRQVTVLETSEAGSRTVDSRMTTLEEADRGGFRFKIDNDQTGTPREAVDGRAGKSATDYTVKLTRPKPENFSIPSEVVFPTEHLKDIIRAARRGEATFAVKVFDGSDEGKQVYDTLTVIGAAAKGGADAVEPALKGDVFTAMVRWPVKISYFKKDSSDNTPAYSVSFELYDNGVTRAVKMDYNDFTLDAKLTDLKIHPASTCAK